MHDAYVSKELFQPVERTIPEYNGHHVWIAVVGHLVDDPSTFDDDSEQEILLDHTTFIGIDGPFCHYCRATYSKGLHSSCTGRPRLT